jgi:hypothetical protein
MDYNRSTTDLAATVVVAGGFTAGAVIAFQTAAANAAIAALAGVPLGVGTFVFPVSSPSGDSEVYAQASILGVHLGWSAGLAGTITIELCNFPGNLDKFGRGGVDVSDFDTVAGNWIPWNPTVSPTDIIQITGTNNTVNKCTITAGGTNAGGAWIDFPAIGLRGPRRARLKFVTTAGGIARVNPCGKLGA